MKFPAFALSSGCGCCWFGFDAGSALAANSVTVHAFIDTQLAASAWLLGWIGFEWATEGYPTALGGSSGAVAGMVAITPCAGFLQPMPSLLVGLVAGVVRALAVPLKFRLRHDDSLDVLGVHGAAARWGWCCSGRSRAGPHSESFGSELRAISRRTIDAWGLVPAMAGSYR